jgi:raffinose/stachyose/melibiose transport system substrate-binding protein
MDSYIKRYGWDKNQSQSVLARDRWSKDGQFGVGETYGISHLGELIGLFYNTKVLADAGISKPPATFEELLADLETLKKHGTSPFMIGTSNGHMALHMLAAISQAHIDASNRKSLDDLIYGQGGTWKTKGNLESARLVQKWANDGYFFPGYKGIGGDDSIPLFLAGQAGFLGSGSWYFGQMKSNPDIHFMAIPAPKGIKATLTVGGVDLAWSISKIADTKEKQDLAASYIDYMVSDEAAVLWANAGFLPAIALPKDASVKVPTLLREGINVWEELNENNALGHYPDWASPTMLRTFDDNTPLLLANRETPEEFIDNLEADYVDYMSNK